MERDERIQEAYQIIVKIDGMCHQGRFDEVNNLLRDMDVESMSEQALVTYLCVSKWAKVKLPSRLEFYKKVEEVLKNRGRQTKELLQGLE